MATSEVEVNLALGGSGPPVLLLHGYPQTHVMWHKVAPRLAERFTVVAADLRGYGDSGKPAGGPDHAEYAKRTMARDQVEVMRALGFDRFRVAGHDRGGRVAHRMALDFPDAVERLAVLDNVPTRHAIQSDDRRLATVYYHWFFLIQPDGLPETLIGGRPEYFLRETLRRWAAPGHEFAPGAMDEYLRCFCTPEAIHASCEDYRAAASIDLEHDDADIDTPIACPVLALWGARGRIHRIYDILGTWLDRCVDVRGRALDCGHFVAEESPEDTLAELEAFFTA